MFTGLAREHRVRVTLYGCCVIGTGGWSPLGLSGYDWFCVITRAYVPAGKKFNLWALGQGDCGFNNLSNIRAYNITKNEPVKELGVGVGYEAYEAPYEAEGACVIELQGWQSAATDQHVSGFMVFSIE